MRKGTSISSFFCLLFVGVLCCSCAVAAPQQPAINSYEDCVKVTGRSMKTFPAQCVAPDGKVFIQGGTKGAVGRLCVDQCGNGQCEEMVCMGQGCPCAETADSCPKDCKK